jgi:hypothetical protein
MTEETEGVETTITATVTGTDTKEATGATGTNTEEAAAAIIRRKRGGDPIVQGKQTTFSYISLG